MKRSLVWKVGFSKLASILFLLSMLFWIGYMTVNGSYTKMNRWDPSSRTVGIELDFSFWGLNEQIVIFGMWFAFAALVLLFVYFAHKEFKIIASDQSCRLETVNDQLIVGYNYLHPQQQILLQRLGSLITLIPLRNIDCVEQTRNISKYLGVKLLKSNRSDKFNSWIALHLKDIPQENNLGSVICIQENLLTINEKQLLLSLKSK